MCSTYTMCCTLPGHCAGAEACGRQTDRQLSRFQIDACARHGSTLNDNGNDVAVAAADDDVD